jgi:hypothetical protein
MDRQTERDLDKIAEELQSIINELSDIAYEVRNGFQNIGNQKCADIIDDVCSKYISVRKDIMKIE